MAESASKQMTKQLKVTQIRSGIGGTHRQRESLKTLGLRKIRQTTVREDYPTVRGMIATVAHLVPVEEVNRPWQIARTPSRSRR